MQDFFLKIKKKKKLNDSWILLTAECIAGVFVSFNEQFMTREF